MADQPIHDVHQARAAWAALQHAGGLMGRAELAERWGVSRPRAGVLVAAPGFPEPVESHGRTDLWLVAEVDEWMRGWSERERRRGPRPRHLDDPGRSDARALSGRRQAEANPRLGDHAEPSNTAPLDGR